MTTTYIPVDKVGWWGDIDERVRCLKCHKVVIESQEIAEQKAEKIRKRGESMFAYRGKCGHWHIGHRK